MKSNQLRRGNIYFFDECSDCSFLKFVDKYNQSFMNEKAEHEMACVQCGGKYGQEACRTCRHR